MSRRLLIVGFGAFPRVPRNPSGILAARIAAASRWRILDVEPEPLVLPTTYAAIERWLEPALADRPDAVLMIGVAARSLRVRVEQRAVNRASLLFPDAAGHRPTTLALDVGGPAQRRSRAAPSVLTQLRRSGLDARASRDAGRYLCNASYYRALAQPCPVVFLHIPKPPDPRRPRKGQRPTPARALDRWTAAFVQAGLGMLTRARRQGTGTSSVRRSTESR